MEEVDKEKTSELSVLTKNEAKSRVFKQETDKDPGVEEDEEAGDSLSHKEQQEESEKITPEKITNLHRHLTALVTNIQITADARESMRRKELEEARRIRLEQLENDVKLSQEKFEEITKGWLTAKEKVIPQELQECLSSQQQLCAVLLENKRKLINELQQELKVRDDLYVKDLRKQTEELDLMMERMEEQIQTLTEAYREELGQMERVYEQESEVLLTKDKTEWEQHTKKLWDQELERLEQRKKKVVEYEAKIHSLMLETMDKDSILQIEQNSKLQIMEREHQKIKASSTITKLKHIKQKYEVEENQFNLSNMKSRMNGLETEIRNLMAKYKSQAKQFQKNSQYMTKDQKRNIQQYERIQKKMKHFANADARKFEAMWLTVDEEVKQLVERALLIDSLICKQHLNLAWEPPPMPFMELSGPIQPQAQTQSSRRVRSDVSQLSQTGQVLQSSRETMDPSDRPGPDTDKESAHMEMCKEWMVMQGESDAEVEEGKLSKETLRKVTELLCDEVGFLMDDKLVKLLAPLEKDEETVVKLCQLLSSFGVEEEDVPKLAHFLLKYKQQHREEMEDVCSERGETRDQADGGETSSSSNLTSDLIHSNLILPALKSFLKQQKSRESSAHQQRSFLHIEARDSSQDNIYWESMGNIITEDKIKLWAAAEKKLHHYLEVLTDISELVPETERLKQQNTELRILVQQCLTPQDSTQLEAQ